MRNNHHHLECESKVAEEATVETKWSKHCLLRLGGGAAYSSHGATCCCSLRPASLSLLTEPCPFAERPSADSDVVYLFDTPVGENSCTTGDLVDSQAECLKAARAFNGADASLPFLAGNISHYPKGCITDGNTIIYNSHTTGVASAAGVRIVCQRPKTTEDRLAATEESVVALEQMMNKEKKDGATSEFVYLFDTPLGQNTCTTGDLVDSEAECLKAARAFNGIDARLVGSDSWSGYPKGCMKDSSTTFYYNSHNTGTAQASYGPVCQRPKTTEDRLAALEQLMNGCPYGWKEEDDDDRCALEKCELGHSWYRWTQKNCKFMCNPNCDVSLAHLSYAAPV